MEQFSSFGVEGEDGRTSTLVGDNAAHSLGDIYRIVDSRSEQFKNTSEMYRRWRIRPEVQAKYSELGSALEKAHGYAIIERRMHEEVGMRARVVGWGRRRGQELYDFFAQLNSGYHRETEGESDDSVQRVRREIVSMLRMELSRITERTELYGVARDMMLEFERMDKRARAEAQKSLGEKHFMDSLLGEKVAQWARAFAIKSARILTWISPAHIGQKVGKIADAKLAEAGVWAEKVKKSNLEARNNILATIGYVALDKLLSAVSGVTVAGVDYLGDKTGNLEGVGIVAGRTLTHGLVRYFAVRALTKGVYAQSTAMNAIEHVKALDEYEQLIRSIKSGDELSEPPLNSDILSSMERVFRTSELEHAAKLKKFDVWAKFAAGGMSFVDFIGNASHAIDNVEHVVASFADTEADSVDTQSTMAPMSSVVDSAQIEVEYERAMNMSFPELDQTSMGNAMRAGATIASVLGSNTIADATSSARRLKDAATVRGDVEKIQKQRHKSAGPVGWLSRPDTL